MLVSIRFGEKTWEEIADYAKRDAVILFPVGTTEEHGSHLPVATDAIIAEDFGNELGFACESAGIPVLLMETIQYGFSMSIIRKWPGCPNVPTRAFMDYIYHIVDSLVLMEFRKIVLLDCHGNHDCLLRTVMREIADRHNVYIMILSPAALCAKTMSALPKTT